MWDNRALAVPTYLYHWHQLLVSGCKLRLFCLSCRLTVCWRGCLSKLISLMLTGYWWLFDFEPITAVHPATIICLAPWRFSSLCSGSDNCSSVQQGSTQDWHDWQARQVGASPRSYVNNVSPLRGALCVYATTKMMIVFICGASIKEQAAEVGWPP